MTDDYTDIRAIHPHYTTIPCRECDREIFVQNSFAYTNDDWYCSDCLPQRLRDMDIGQRVEVRL